MLFKKYKGQSDHTAGDYSYESIKEHETKSHCTSSILGLLPENLIHTKLQLTLPSAHHNSYLACLAISIL